MDEIILAIDQALDSKKMKSATASKLAVGHTAFIKNLRKSVVDDGVRLHPIEGLIRLAEVLDLELHLGPKRPTVIPSTSIASDDEFAKVDRYLVDLSAGPGSNGDNAEKIAPMAFRADWMRQQGLEVGKCVVVSVKGDSMTPTLADGDLVLVDRTEQPIRNMQIYAFVDPDGNAMVKRFELGEDQLIIRSDNPAYPTTVLAGPDANRLNRIGRVVWSGHTV